MSALANKNLRVRHEYIEMVILEPKTRIRTPIRVYKIKSRGLQLINMQESRKKTSFLSFKENE